MKKVLWITWLVIVHVLAVVGAAVIVMWKVWPE